MKRGKQGHRDASERVKQAEKQAEKHGGQEVQEENKV